MTLPAEWHPQAFVQLTWPHPNTDWAPILREVTECYCQMAREITLREPLLIVTPQPAQAKEALALHGVSLQDVSFFECDTNDTWARDHAFITCLEGGRRVLHDFQFNGWGLKFAANHDNQINRRLSESHTVEGRYACQLDFVLEGGSIESDGEGTLLTTASCLMAPNRNQPLTQCEIEQRLRATLGCKRVLWLHHSRLAGDDTDGHIDTVARFCNPETIAYVQCTDPADEHYAELQSMEAELQAFTTASGQPYRLLPLPMPAPIYDPTDLDEAGNPQRLPATYANFLILNSAVLMPTYGQPDTDRQAIERLEAAFPSRTVVGIDCRALIRQHGSLHCCTMQYPKVC